MDEATGRRGADARGHGRGRGHHTRWTGVARHRRTGRHASRPRRRDDAGDAHSRTQRHRALQEVAPSRRGQQRLPRGARTADDPQRRDPRRRNREDAQEARRRVVPAIPWKSISEAPPDAELTAMASRLPLRSYASIFQFLSATTKIRKQLAETPGLVGYALDAHIAGKT